MINIVPEDHEFAIVSTTFDERPSVWKAFLIMIAARQEWAIWGCTALFDPLESASERDPPSDPVEAGLRLLAAAAEGTMYMCTVVRRPPGSYNRVNVTPSCMIFCSIVPIRLKGGLTQGFSPSQLSARHGAGVRSN